MKNKKIDIIAIIPFIVAIVGIVILFVKNAETNTNYWLQIFFGLASLISSTSASVVAGFLLSRISDRTLNIKAKYIIFYCISISIFILSELLLIINKGVLLNYLLSVLFDVISIIIAYNVMIVYSANTKQTENLSKENNDKFNEAKKRTEFKINKDQYKV